MPLDPGAPNPAVLAMATARVVLFASVLFTYRANEGTLVRCMTCI